MANVATMGRNELEYYTKLFLEHYRIEPDTLDSLRIAASKAAAYRDSKGFIPATWDTLPTRLTCILAEIHELTEALQSADYHDDMSQVAKESADVGMYTLNTLADLFGDSWTIRQRYHGGSKRFARPETLTTPLRKEVCKAFEHWRRGRKTDVQICLELELAALIDLRSRVLGFRRSLLSDIEAKIAVDSGREKLHGGKDPRS
jgi:NTP pyrophosphatase (non-canonical NTP hydrolase)